MRQVWRWADQRRTWAANRFIGSRMRLLTRVQFLDLPEGVLYAKVPEPIVFDDLCVKGETCRHEDGRAFDWWYRSLNDYDSDNDGDCVGKFDQLKAGGSVPLHNAWARDGLFDEGDMFLVYEDADCARLLQLVHEARAALSLIQL